MSHACSSLLQEKVKKKNKKKEKKKKKGVIKGVDIHYTLKSTPNEKGVKEASLK